MWSPSPDILILIVLFLEYLSLSLVKGILPIMLYTSPYLSDYNIYILIGIAEAVKGIFAFLMCPLIGKISDYPNIGRRPILFLTVLGTTIPICSLAYTENLKIFLILLGISGIFSSTFPLTFAYISDWVESDKRASSYGLALATFGLSFSLGPSTGAYIALNWGQQSVFIISNLLVLFNLFFILFFIPDKRRGEGPKPPIYHLILEEDNIYDDNDEYDITEQRPRSFSADEILNQPLAYSPLDAFNVLQGDYLLSTLAKIVFLYYTGVFALVSTLMLYVTWRFHFNELQTGYLLTAFGLCTMISEGVIVRYVVPWIGEKKSLQFGLLAFALQSFIIAFATTKYLVYLGMLLSFITNLVYPSISSLVSKRVDNTSQGEALGGINGIKAFTEGFSPLLFGGILLSMFQGTSYPGAPYAVSGIFSLLALYQSRLLPHIQGEYDDDDIFSSLNDLTYRIKGKFHNNYIEYDEESMNLLGTEWIDEDDMLDNNDEDEIIFIKNQDNEYEMVEKNEQK